MSSESLNGHEVMQLRYGGGIAFLCCLNCGLCAYKWNDYQQYECAERQKNNLTHSWTTRFSEDEEWHRHTCIACGAESSTLTSTDCPPYHYLSCAEAAMRKVLG